MPGRRPRRVGLEPAGGRGDPDRAHPERTSHHAVKHSANGAGDGAIGCVLDCDDDRVRVAISNRARLPDGFSLARIPNGVSGLGLVRALLPKKSASLSIEQSADDVVATVTLRPPGVQRAGA